MNKQPISQKKHARKKKTELAHDLRAAKKNAGQKGLTRKKKHTRRTKRTDQGRKTKELPHDVPKWKKKRVVEKKCMFFRGFPGIFGDFEHIKKS